MTKEIKVPISGRPFKNNATYCVGTGRMGLALQKEYIDHLELVQESIKFRYIRGHGLFCDDVGIYRE
ncbi:MAG: GH39 family glycosyl hydrolase, partial [Halanaerobiales bacterium]